MKPLVLLRPEPGLRQSADAARSLKLKVIECPLFEVRPLEWTAPPAGAFDALLLTSANAVRHGGSSVAEFRELPVLAVGEATAVAAREAGFTVEQVGGGGVADLLSSVPPERRLLHLCGTDVWDSKRAMTRVAVYAAVATDNVTLPSLSGAVIAVHSPRAGQRLAELAHDRGGATIAAISAAAAIACGLGWAYVEVAPAPDDLSLLALAARLCQVGGRA